MIKDEILRRKEGRGYSAKHFCWYCSGVHEHGNNIARALAAGTNTDACNAINAYIIDRYGLEHSADIREYVNGCNWLEDEEPQKRC